MSRWDAIVIGADPNGLAAAITLARAGRRALVVEPSDAVGGPYGAGELDGVRHTGLDADLSPAVVEALQLRAHGLAVHASEIALAGSGFRLDGSLGADAAGVARVRALAQAARPVVAALSEGPLPALRGPLWPLLRHAVAVRRAVGRDRLSELLRVGPDALEPWLAEHVKDARIRAGLALGALIDAWHGPLSPQSAGLFLWREASGRVDPVGGSAAVVAAMVAAARAAGVEIRLGAPVEGIEAERGAVRAVRLAGGAEEAGLVVSALAPRRTLALLDPRHVPPAVADAARAVRTRATSAVLFATLAAPGAGRLRVVTDPLGLERAFDAAKHRRFAEAPALDVVTHGAALTARVFGASEVGWTPETRAAVRDRALAALRAAEVGEVVAATLVAPPDLEARYGGTGGHPMHAELALDQLWFPHDSGVRGLWFGSAATRPRSALGGSGLVAARSALEAR